MSEKSEIRFDKQTIRPRLNENFKKKLNVFVISGLYWLCLGLRLSAII